MDGPELDSGSTERDGEVAQRVAGQSGNEGTSLRYPCFFDTQAIVTVEVTDNSGGCFQGTVQELLSPGASDAGLVEGDTIGGVTSLFYSSQEPEIGDSVLVQYYPEPGATGASLNGSVRVTPMSEGQVTIEWLGGSYEFSPEELLAADCPALYEDLPNLETDDGSGVDPDDGQPPAETPLSCPAP